MMTTPIKVYIVLIGNKRLHPRVRVGACYWTAEEAREECRRLNDANGYTDAWYVERGLPNLHLQLT